MTVSRTELIGIVAILLYIVFFSHSPPYALRSALGNVYVAGTIFAALTYVTLCINQSIGVLMIVAFILTMTRVTEQFTEGMTAAEQEAAAKEWALEMAAAKERIAQEIDKMETTTEAQREAKRNRILANTPPTNTPTPLPPPMPSGTPVTAGATTSAAPAQAMPPVVAAPATVAAPTAPAVPGVTATPPAPVMSCNVESFAPF